VAVRDIPRNTNQQTDIKMITHEEFKKAIAIVKEYQLQVENDYKSKKKEFLNIELTAYNPDSKLWDMDVSVSLRNLLHGKGFNHDSTIYDISLVHENELLKIRGFGKERLKELIKLKHLAGL
jgi:DNA-directed RNA polymerase alpha subunit